MLLDDARCLDLEDEHALITGNFYTEKSGKNLPAGWKPLLFKKLGRHLIVRSNLAILADSQYSDFTQIYTQNKVEIAASLPDCDENRAEYSDHISRFDMKKLCRRPIALHNHCYGCTAGAGSSCQGALE